MEATNPDPDNDQEVDYFSEPAGFSNKLFRFTANANDANDDSLTYVWKFPNGDVKKTEGRASVVLHGFSDDLRDGDSKTVTLLVTDSNGNTATKRKTITWKQDTTTRYSGWAPSFEASPSNPEQGERVTLSYTPPGYLSDDRAVEAPEPSFSVRVSWGDGTSDTVRNHDSENRLALAHQYDTGGKYTVQIYPLDRHGNLVSGSEVSSVSINVEGGMYEVYKYKSEVVAEEKVAASPPGDLWTEKEYHHTDSELLSEQNQDIPAGNRILKETMLMDGWEQEGSHTELVHDGYYTQESWQDPGQGWRKIEDSIRTTRVRDGWDYRVYDERRSSGGHAIDGGSPGTFVEKVKDYYQRTLSTESTDSPGAGWRRGDSVGKEQSGWDYFWSDSRLYAPGAQLVDTRQTQTEPRTSSTEYLLRNKATGSTYWSSSSSGGMYYDVIDTRTDVDPAEYDTDYQYKTADYETVYEWTRTVTTYDWDYKYKFKDYRDEPVHRWEKPKYVEKLFLDMRKATYDHTVYYVYEKSGVTQEVSLKKPPQSAVVGTVRKVQHKCTNPDAPLNEQAC